MPTALRLGLAYIAAAAGRHVCAQKRLHPPRKCPALLHTCQCLRGAWFAKGVELRRIVAFISALLVSILPVSAAPARIGELSSSAEILAWINSYRGKPAPDDVPAAALRLSRLGMFKDPESAGVYVGFMAGILGSHPERAERMIGKMLTMPPEDHWALVRAI